MCFESDVDATDRSISAEGNGKGTHRLHVEPDEPPMQEGNQCVCDSSFRNSNDAGRARPSAHVHHVSVSRRQSNQTTRAYLQVDQPAICRICCEDMLKGGIGIPLCYGGIRPRWKMSGRPCDACDARMTHSHGVSCEPAGHCTCQTSPKSPNPRRPTRPIHRPSTTTTTTTTTMVLPTTSTAAAFAACVVTTAAVLAGKIQSTLIAVVHVLKTVVMGTSGATLVVGAKQW